MLLYYDRLSLTHFYLFNRRNHLQATLSIQFQQQIKIIHGLLCRPWPKSKIALHYTFSHSPQLPLYLLFHPQIDRSSLPRQICCILCLPATLFVQTKIIVRQETLLVWSHTLSKIPKRFCNRLGLDYGITRLLQCPRFTVGYLLNCRPY